MPVMNGIEATEQITQIAPQTKVIMVTVQDSTEYFQKAFRVRAADYVTKPIKAADLFEAIDRYLINPRLDQLHSLPPAPTAVGHVVALVSFKGGTGKTTLAINLALGLTKANRKVVLVDADILFGDIGVSLNVKGQNTIIDMARMAADPDDIEQEVAEKILTSHDSGLKVLLAPSDPGDYKPISAEAMSNMLEFLKQQFDYVIVDTSRNIDDMLLAIIRSADRLLVATTATMTALKDTRFMFSELKGVGATNKVMLVLNQFARHNQVTPEQMTNHLKVPIAAQIPFDPNAVNALNHGIGLITLDPGRAPSARPLLGLAGVIMRHFETGEPAPVGDPSRKAIPV